MPKVTVVHITQKVKIPIILASGLMFIEPTNKWDDLDRVVDSVAREMGLGPDHRRVGAVWFCLPTWTQTIDWFYEGMQPTSGLAPGLPNAVVATDVDPDKTFAYNFSPLWEANESNERIMARRYWESAVPLSKLVGKHEPWPGESEVLVRGPILPWRLKAYRSWRDFQNRKI